MDSTVRVAIRGGTVEEVEFPPGITVIVRDYDTDGIEDDLTSRDAAGDAYVESVWDRNT